ncbi:MAG: PIN domain-containing protein [Gammaproteobacteria bacterium]|nr:PIN domain-containing protein [Gammaproteobacteria bacterium]MCY4323053.1 PIN domain-containing protein [Gammaproteobacteria bacterium]
MIDTSIWIRVLRGARGDLLDSVQSLVADDNVVLTRFNQLEILQGAANEQEWNMLHRYLKTQDYLEVGAETWPQAARIFFDLRRKGLTVRSAIDCCIAQLAIEHNALLLHDDRDFDVIAKIRPLTNLRLSIG